ncbi:MAG: hypothetical protein SVY53_01060 [Chloroflexota bacterium]|nr:hypothetical protein [Chloroflexota bacterium]
MDPISVDIVEGTWEMVATLSEEKVQKLAVEMREEQPTLMMYLLAVDDDILNQEEREMLFYMGTLIWLIMSQGTQILPTITEESLDAAEEKNIEMLECLKDKDEAEYMDALMGIVENYGQPAILRCVVELLMDDSEEDAVIRDESVGAMFIDLKTVIDCFDV